jgi:hypothetical protein
MVSKNKIKDALKKEFNSILPNVYDNVIKTKATPQPLGMNISIKKRLVLTVNQIILTASLLIGIMSYGGFSYYTPNTIMSIVVTPNIINTILKLNSPEQIALADDKEVMLTMSINDYNMVVDLESDSAELNEKLSNLNLHNKQYRIVLKQLIINLDQEGKIDLNNNVGQVRITILDSNKNRRERISNYINDRLHDELGMKENRIIKTERIEFETSIGSVSNVHPAKAMAINEIMLNSNEYTLDELLRKDKVELIKIMMRIKRNKR